MVAPWGGNLSLFFDYDIVYAQSLQTGRRGQAGDTWTTGQANGPGPPFAFSFTGVTK